MMFKVFVVSCILATVAANPGILSQSLGIAAAPAIISQPSISVIRTAPIALGTRIGTPVALTSGVVSNGLVSNGLISGGVVSSGLVSGGLIKSGKVISGGLISSGLIH